MAPLDLPEGWRHPPPLLQALALAAHHAHGGGHRDLPVLPQLLQALGITRSLLPVLTPVDRAWLSRPRDYPACARRMLRQLEVAAGAGLQRLQQIETDHVRAEHALATQTRVGLLREIVMLARTEGVLVPRHIAVRLGLSISGAGKLLARAAELGLLVEVTGRTSWRIYLVPDLARQFGYMSIPRGRPPSPALPPAPLGSALAAFDAEMTAIDALLARSGSGAGDGH